jgi:hypothetical protein
VGLNPKSKPEAQGRPKRPGGSHMKTMKEYETMKVYGKKVNRWTAYDEIKGRAITTQIEVEYKE